MVLRVPLALAIVLSLQASVQCFRKRSSKGTEIASSGTWTVQTLQHEGVTRSYHVHVPSNGGKAGLMILLHGCCMRDEKELDNYKNRWQVAENAQAHDFIAVMPVASNFALDWAWGPMNWNIDNPSGPNDVKFIHNVVQAVVAEHAVPEDAPKIVLGFSLGTKLALLMGCQPPPRPWFIAHQAVHYDANANFPSTCAHRESTWKAVGDGDFFLDNSWLDPENAREMPKNFDGARRLLSGDARNSGCGEHQLTVTTGSDGSDYSCYEYPDCPSVGQLCLYTNTKHHVKPSIPGLAWKYLTAA